MHIKAMKSPEAAGERFIAAGQYATMAEIAAMMRARLPDHAPRIPANRAPDWLIKMAALVDRDLREVTPGLGRKRSFSSAKAQRMLGWTPRDVHETVMDCATSLITHGVA
jgi:nucleoside-diphosphate-sugar epimerase